MSDALSLSWLPDAADWDDRLKALRTADVSTELSRAETWTRLVALADCRLDPLKTNRLDRTAQALFAAAPPDTGAVPRERLAVLSSATTTHLLPSLRVGAMRRGIWLETFEPAFGQYFQALAETTGALAAFAPTSVLLALDARHATRGLDPFADEAATEATRVALLAHIRACWRLCRERIGAPLLQQTILPVFDPLLGGNEHRLPGSPVNFVRALNAALRTSTIEDGVAILSLDDRCARDGLDAWHQPSLWLKAKQEIAPGAGPLYGDLVARQIAARLGRARKVLVLDLDNTLWGGVIGDDGLDGLVLGQGSATGESFLALQAHAKALARRGIILAVCSKNDAANALLPFTDHPDMILRRDDIAAFVANWDDKASNIRKIAAELNVGLEALVFVDDNPFERDLVRRELPMVAVPEVPEEPALVARCLADAGYFESGGLTEDDLRRTGQYQANAARGALAAGATDLDGYLRGLDMRLVWRRFDAAGLGRIVQLFNKTNQFNLTTRRVTDADMAALMARPDAFGLQFRLIDRFGDNGMIAIVTGRRDGDSVVIDDWLMSCRVLGRTVETATLAIVASQTRAIGALRLVGVYRPSGKNAMVAEHYERLGFTREADAADGAARWSLDLSEAAFSSGPIEIVAER